ncbi:MAG: hypothetical protein K2L71_08435, partial [Muribaculaceae bacterium]|nr:hypothetical protein [Muribaculaceae bacterium]
CTACFSQFVTKQPFTPHFLFLFLTFINIDRGEQFAKNTQKHSHRQLPAHLQKNTDKAPEYSNDILRVFSASLY